MEAAASLKGKSREVLAKEKEKELREKAKREDEKRKKEEVDLLKPVIIQHKVPFGVDPKTILCAFYKAGHCEKGNKCKFSHDLDVGRKVEKKNLYADSREEKLAGMCLSFFISGGSLMNCPILRYYGHLGRREAAAGGHVESRQSSNVYGCQCHPSFPRSSPDHLFRAFPLQIVCKNFIQAIETQKYAPWLSYRSVPLQSRPGSVGSGSVPTAKIANIDTHCLLGSFSSRSVRLLKRLRREV